MTKPEEDNIAISSDEFMISLMPEMPVEELTQAMKPVYYILCAYHDYYHNDSESITGIYDSIVDAKENASSVVDDIGYDYDFFEVYQVQGKHYKRILIGKVCYYDTKRRHYIDWSDLNE